MYQKWLLSGNVIMEVLISGGKIVSYLFMLLVFLFVVRLRHLELVSQHRFLVLLSGLTFIAWVFGFLLIVTIPT